MRFQSETTKVGAVGAAASLAAKLIQSAIDSGLVTPETLALLKGAGVEYYVLLAAFVLLAKKTPDNKQEEGP